jgi:hypothetical protein
LKGYSKVTKGNITDRSKTLLVETNRNEEIIHFDDCPRVTWGGKLSYLRQIHLPQLLSAEVKEQLVGFKGFEKIIPHRSQFPIEEYISLGFFSRVQEIHSLISQSQKQEFYMPILFMFSKLIESGYTSRLIEIGFVDFMIHGIDLSTSSGFESVSTNKEWLTCFRKISESRNHCRVLLSRGILSKLITLPLVSLPCACPADDSNLLLYFRGCGVLRAEITSRTSQSLNSLTNYPTKGIRTKLEQSIIGFD